MRKDLRRIVILFLIFIHSSISILAGDIPEGLMSGNQDAVLIGQIKTINEQHCIIEPITVMMGHVEEEEIQVNKFEKYYGTDEKPQENDYIVVVLLEEGLVDDEWVFKSTSEDYKSLNLVSERYNMVERYEEYINNGDYFEAQKQLDEEMSVEDTIKQVDTVQEASEEVIDNIDNKFKAQYIIIVVFMKLKRNVYFITGLMITLIFTGGLIFVNIIDKLAESGGSNNSLEQYPVNKNGKTYGLISLIMSMILI